jgi:hypothetical protein
MNSELALKLLDVLDQNAPIHFELPVPLDQITNVSIRTTPTGQRFLRFTIGGPLTVAAPFECVLEEVEPFEPATAAVLTRVWVTGTLYLQILFGALAPRYILVRCAPGSNLPDEAIPPGTVLGTAEVEIEMAFLTSNDPSAQYLDPAIIVRILALLSKPYEDLLFLAIKQNPADSFGVQRFFDFYDMFDEPAHQKRLYQDVLRLEYEGRTSQGIPTDLVTQAFYRIRLPAPSGSTITRADLVATYHSAVEGSPDKFVSFYLSDLNLDCAIFRADRYEMDLIDIRTAGMRFTSLIFGSLPYKIIVNGPVFDSGVCGKQPFLVRASWYLTVIDAAKRGLDMNGKTKGLLVFRGQTTELGDCSLLDLDPKFWTYHFGQSVSGNYGLHLNPIPVNHDYASAVDPAIGVFRNGLRIGHGHEIDMLGSDGTPRQMPDIPYAGKEVTQGIPILGRCQRLGVEYLFVLMRPDSFIAKAATAEWEDMIALLEDIGVIDAFITDGDDSVGLIIDNTLCLVPGPKKDSPMPLAIGFRKV